MELYTTVYKTFDNILYFLTDHVMIDCENERADEF